MHPSRPPARSRSVVFAGVALSAVLLATPLAASAQVSGPVSQDIALAAASSFQLPAGPLTAGATASVGYATDQPDAKNWIGFYRDGEVPGGAGQFSATWAYAPGDSGTVSLDVPSTPGVYTLWYLAKDGYEPLASAQTVTVSAAASELLPGDPSAAVDIDPVATGVATDGVLLREGFAAGVPDGWTASTSANMDAAGAAAYRGWVPTTRPEWTAGIDEMRARFARPLAGFLVADAQQFGTAPFSATLTSASVDVEYLRSLRLTFDSHYRGAPGQAGVVRASFDGGAWTEILRLDSASVTDGYDPLQMNYSQDISVAVPEAATEVRFEWQLDAPAAGGRYWAIDSVAVHQGALAADTAPTQLWTVSDIQGHPHDFEHGLNDLHALAPDPAGLLIVGDLVNSGTTAEWDEMYAVMDDTTAIRPETTVASIGNHERYATGGFAANFERFLAFAERDKAYAEYVLEGPGGQVPVITVGQEIGGPTDVAMTDEQVEFLEERLAYWTARGSQVIVNTHFPLGDTVSASWIPWYHDHHLMNDRLTSILGNYPNAVVFSGHTHYPATLGDWAVQRRTADGHPDGFWSVNTVAMHVGWDARGENTDGISEVTIGDVNNGLIVESFGDRLVVKAFDFFTDQQIREVTIPNPLVPFAADVVPAEERPADYSAVDAALGLVPQDLARYTPASVEALERAVAAVERGLTVADQDGVDAMAAAIRAAIEALVLVESPGAGDGGADGGAGGGADAGAGGDAGSGSGADAGSLATTGFDPGVTWIVALGLLGLGGAVLGVRRLIARRLS
ncbi:DUF4073 domain-containing protein [Microbacterium sp. 3J1]|uniref:DUF4073 domain-containing protein n=1 Tax=Microbacterium sp. 3J1 TaxID=861269 RepID=UPI000A5C1428|nr:DUF4073 domain-containing protein [Microbacterium sp. 3J1]